MTPEQSKRLKVGTRVFFNGNPADGGIKWDDGHESFTGHNEMNRVERLRVPDKFA